MQSLSQAMVTELTAAQQTKADLLAYHITIHFQQIRSIYIESMQNLLSNIEPPAAFLFMRNLIYDKNHCESFSCYRNSYFTNTRGTITAHTEKYDIFLAQKALITCKLSGKNSTSILHNIIVSKKKQVYIPDNTKITPLNISAFHIQTAKGN